MSRLSARVGLARLLPFLRRDRRRTGGVPRQEWRGRETRPRMLESLESRQVFAQVSGSIAADAVWSRANSPYEVTADVVVQSTATLTIEPGVVVQFRGGAGLQVKGRLLAEGTPDARIRMEKVAGGSRWDGLDFASTLQDSRITFTDMDSGDAQGEAIHVVNSRLYLENVVWTGTTGTILELNHPSLIVRDSMFPKSNGDEVIHGENLSGNEYLVVDGNVFANSNNGGDVIDFLGPNRPGPVLQILNNVFQGGGDDGLDLDGTDAHIEGNVFMNFRKNTSRATTSNAIATGLPQTGATNRTEITVVRNVFMNNDHAMLLKEDAFATVQNNVFVNNTLAVMQFNEEGGTAVLGAGKGAAVDGNIFWNNAKLFKNLVNSATFKTQLTVNQSLLPNESVAFGATTVPAHSLGTGNLEGDPLFVDAAAGNYRLLAGSPARGTGPLGMDMGALVVGGPAMRLRSPASADGKATLDVGGPGITHYRYRVGGGAWSVQAPVTEPIQLTGLAQGDQQVEVVGMNSAGEWYTGETPAWRDRAVDLLAPRRVRKGETLPVVARGLDWQRETDVAWNALVSLANSSDLSATSLKFQHGVATLNPTVLASADFQLSTPLGSRAVQVLPDDFPVENISGTLVGNTTWTADREYRVTGEVVIPAGSQLTIEAGTRVLMGDRANLRVDGLLQSLGTASDPVFFNALDAAKPWGGLEFRGAASNRLRYTFFTRGGGDTSRTFGHSNSQPVLYVSSGNLACENCFITHNVGKAFGSKTSRIQIADSVLSHVDTGAQFDNSVVLVDRTWLMNISDEQQTFVDDDNDGFYFAGAHPSGEASEFRNSHIVRTKDDGIDHNGAILKVLGSWIDGTFHEGIATSNKNTVEVEDTVVQRANQGIEAGYGGPMVTVTRSVVVANRTQVDPKAPINAGLRFGDGYDGSNGAYTGKITASYMVLADNGDNVRNYDGSIPGPKPGALVVTNSLANDPDASDPSNLSGVPVFGRRMHLLRGSAGFTAGPDGMPLGRPVPARSVLFRVGSPADFNEDGKLDVADVDLFCAAMQSPQPEGRFDLNGDGLVNEADRDMLIVDYLKTTYGDAGLDGVFDSGDLVEVFARGKYENAQAVAASWSDGDWNCDGAFDTSDLVLAFQSGGYSAAAQVAASPIAPLADPSLVAAALEGADGSRKTADA